ncbi:MAG: hypothetical protein M1822_006700 [Bathelium mastoideum]|nr:MAG: hypothetical protein M1822_006700 [Bathelium mastoideum]
MAEENPPLGDGKRGVSRFLTKRWKGRHASNEDTNSKNGPPNNFALNEDVNDFLKPSTAKAQAAKLYPQIDVAVAQRWPDATEIGGHDIVKTSTIPGGLKSKGRRKEGLVVAFVRTAPEVIGEGGDETETPSIEISKRRTLEKLQAKADAAPTQGSQISQDDSALDTSTAGLSRGLTRAAEVKSKRKSKDWSEGAALRRSQTIGGGMTSPPLESKFRAQRAQQSLAAPTQAPEPLDHGFRPSPLQRTQTGLQTDVPRDDDAPNSAMTQGSLQETPIDAETPPQSRLIGGENPPKHLPRNGYGQEPARNFSSDIEKPRYDRLPLNNITSDASPPIPPYQDFDTFLHTKPTSHASSPAEFQHQMRAEEGQTLHDAAHGVMPLPVVEYSSSAPFDTPERHSEDSVAPRPSIASSSSGISQDLSPPAVRQSLSSSPAMPVPSQHGKPQGARAPPFRPSPQYEADSPQSTRSTDTTGSQRMAAGAHPGQFAGQPPILNVPQPPPHTSQRSAPRIQLFHQNSSTDDFASQVMGQWGGPRSPAQEHQYQEIGQKQPVQQSGYYGQSQHHETVQSSVPLQQDSVYQERPYQPTHQSETTQNQHYKPFSPHEAPSQEPFHQETALRPKPAPIDLDPSQVPQIAQEEITPRAFPSDAEATYLPQLAYGETTPQPPKPRSAAAPRSLDLPYDEANRPSSHRRQDSSPSRMIYPPMRQSPTRLQPSPTRGLMSQFEQSATRKPVQAYHPPPEQRSSDASERSISSRRPIPEESPTHKPVSEQRTNRRPVVQVDPSYGRPRGPSIDQSPSRRPIPSPQPSPGFGGSQGDATLDEFAVRVVHMKGIFRLTAEKDKPIQASLMEWLRASIWWFLKGKAGLEDLIRGRPQYLDPSDPQWREQLAQPHVDLAKCWWIVTEVVQSHPDWVGEEEPRSAVTTSSRGSTRASEFERVYDVVEHVLSNLKALTMSMSRNNVMPPSASLIQGQDTTIWVEYPSFSLDVKASLSGTRSKSILMEDVQQKEVYNLSSIIPLADTSTDFYYGRMFVNASISTDEEDRNRIPFACVVSLIRDRTDYQIKMLICTQSELANLCVQPDRKLAPSWYDVQWETPYNSLSITMPRGYKLHLEFTERDFKTIRSIYDYTTKLEASLQPLPDGQERFAYEVTLRDFQLTDPTNSYGFPPDRIPRCRARVFKRIGVQREPRDPTGQRRLHLGYRLLVVTSPRIKTLRSLTYELAQQVLINFEFQNDGDVSAKGAPVLLLRLPRGERQITLFMSFHDANERNTLYYILNGMSVTSHEDIVARLKLDGVSVRPAMGASQQDLTMAPDPLRELQWKDLVVINRRAEEEGETVKTVGSESLRVVARHAAGALTDRCNFGSGELHLRLPPSNPVSNTSSLSSSLSSSTTSATSPSAFSSPYASSSLSPSISILRAPATSLTSSTDPRATSPSVPAALATVLQTALTAPTIRTYTFPTLAALHKFQEVLTGQRVRFDGLAERVSISRKRTGSMMPGLTKRSLEARNVRVQIVRGLSGSEFGGAPTSQILLFFEGFPAADAMNFQLRPTDAYERVDGKASSVWKDRDRDRDRESSPAGSTAGASGAGDGRFGVRLVDAKFSLPHADFEEKEKERRKERERADKEGRGGSGEGKRDSGGREKDRDKENVSARWRMSRSNHSTPEIGAYGDGEELPSRAQELGLEKATGIAGGREAEALRRRFVCLELELEFAEMHDDVFVGFGSEQERDAFCDALPAAATSMSRGMTFKRR